MSYLVLILAAVSTAKRKRTFSFKQWISRSILGIILRGLSLFGRSKQTPSFKNYYACLQAVSDILMTPAISANVLLRHYNCSFLSFGCKFRNFPICLFCIKNERYIMYIWMLLLQIIERTYYFKLISAARRGTEETILMFGKVPSRHALGPVTKVAWLKGLWDSSNLGLQRPRGAMNPRPPGQLSMLLTGIDSHFPEYKQNKPYARLGARKLLETEGKENKRAFPALHRLEKSEFSRPRDRKVQRSRSIGKRIWINLIQLTRSRFNNRRHGL